MKKQTRNIILITGIALFIGYFFLWPLIIVVNTTTITYPSYNNDVYGDNCYELYPTLLIETPHSTVDDIFVSYTLSPDPSYDIASFPSSMQSGTFGLVLQTGYPVYQSQDSRYIFSYNLMDPILEMNQKEYVCYIIYIQATIDGAVYSETRVINLYDADFPSIASKRIDGVEVTDSLIISGTIDINVGIALQNYLIDANSVNLLLEDSEGQESTHGSFTKDTSLSTSTNEIYYKQWDSKSVVDGTYTIYIVFNAEIKTRALHSDIINLKFPLFSVCTEEGDDKGGLIPGFTLIVFLASLFILAIFYRQKKRDRRY